MCDTIDSRFGESILLNQSTARGSSDSPTNRVRVYVLMSLAFLRIFEGHQQEIAVSLKK